MNSDDYKKFEEKYYTEDIVDENYEKLSVQLLKMARDDETREKIKRNII